MCEMARRETKSSQARSGRFFREGSVADPIYTKIRDATGSPLCEARCFIEQMWAECGQFIDPDAPKRGAKEYNSVFGELYVPYTLHTAGVSLVARANRTPCRKGPDLLSENPRVWIEVVTPAAGEEPHGLIEPEPYKVFDVPTGAYVLRLLNAIVEKSRKFKTYRDQGTIASTDATVIAMSGARLPFRFHEGPIPSIVQAVLGVGALTIDIDRVTGKILGRCVEYSDRVAKNAGASVMTDLFLKSDYAHISAILYSPADCVNHPAVPGPDFILVHHAAPATRIDHGWLPFGVEYWIDGKAGLCCTRHS